MCSLGALVSGAVVLCTRVWCSRWGHPCLMFSSGVLVGCTVPRRIRAHTFVECARIRTSQSSEPRFTDTMIAIAAAKKPQGADECHECHDVKAMRCTTRVHECHAVPWRECPRIRKCPSGRPGSVLLQAQGRGRTTYVYHPRPGHVLVVPVRPSRGRHLSREDRTRVPVGTIGTISTISKWCSLLQKKRCGLLQKQIAMRILTILVGELRFYIQLYLARYCRGLRI